MTNPLLLVDSDAFTLLAAADLLDPLAIALQIDPENIRRLPALPHQLDRGRRLRKQYDAGAIARARAACERYPAVPGIPADLDRLARLNQVSHLDEGEALLFALLCEHPSWLLTTGDKRAVIALGTAAGMQDVRDQLRGRILPLKGWLSSLSLGSVRQPGRAGGGSGWAIGADRPAEWPRLDVCVLPGWQRHRRLVLPSCREETREADRRCCGGRRRGPAPLPSTSCRFATQVGRGRPTCATRATQTGRGRAAWAFRGA